MDRRLIEAEARLRELACHRLGGRLLAPLVFEQLQTALPFAACLYTWIGPQGAADVCFSDDRVGAVVLRYSDAYFRKTESEVWMTVDDAARELTRPHHLRQGLRIPLDDYYRHPIYGEIMGPAGLHTMLRFVVQERGLPLGFMSLGRDRSERDFSAEDLSRLTRLAPFISTAMNATEAIDAHEYGSESTGLLIVDGLAQVKWASPSAHRLIWLAFGRSPAPAGWPGMPSLAVSGLERIHSGVADAVPPVTRRRNAWGDFLLRAYWLDPQEPAASLIGIAIERSVPRSLLALRELQAQHLPPRQVEVGVRIALGMSETQVAAEIGVSRNTVVYHRRQIYNRLGVTTRQELAQRLFGRA